MVWSLVGYQAFLLSHVKKARITLDMFALRTASISVDLWISDAECKQPRRIMIYTSHEMFCMVKQWYTICVEVEEGPRAGMRLPDLYVCAC